MNATITREVITDLLPAYLSGDVSGDTRALIETYMQQDPEFAALIKTEAKVVFPNAVPSRSGYDPELAALRKTKRLLRRRGWYMGLALFFTLTAASYQYGPEGFKWTWQDAPLASVLCAMVGLTFWFAYFRSRRRLKLSGV